MKYYYNEDNTAIGALISSDYGSGWSTYNNNEVGLALDRDVISYWLYYKDNRTEEELREDFARMGYDVDNFYGWKNIQLVWVPVDATFRIMEYDGAEYVEIFDASAWITVK